MKGNDMKHTPGQRYQFIMTDEQLNILLKACQPVPYMVIGGVEPISPQERANNAWRDLGGEMGFDHMTVQPVRDMGPHVFTAVTTPEAK